MFTEMKTLVARASEGHYALLAINCVNLETARAAIRTAEKYRAPVILNLYQAHLGHFPAEVAFPLARALAEQARVPVTLSLDHGKDPTLIRRCFRAGFSGLMIDASAFPLEENIRQTRDVVALAECAGVCVEGELGHLGDAPVYNHATNRDLMTRPEDVAPFIAGTGIDVLAVSVGTAHGMYPPGVAPEIDFDRLAAIQRQATVPLALHGGSGTPFDALARCPRYGVAKINVGAAIFDAGKNALLHALCHDKRADMDAVMAAMEAACAAAIEPYMEASGSPGKA